MKRNMVPLLGIAFVVAIISTGVFYGLFAGRLRSSTGDVPEKPVVVAARDLQRGAVLQPRDVQVSQVKGSLSGSFSKPDQAVGATLLASLKQNEPILEDRVVTKDPQTGQPRGSVPQGMRAVSMRVSDSEGLIGLLSAGARVDIQAMLDRNGTLQLRTVLQNVELLAVSSQPQSFQGIAGPVYNITVLTDADATDLAALVDSGSHVRVALRNPLDPQIASRRSLALAAAFQSKGESLEQGTDDRGKNSRQAVSMNSTEPGFEIRVRVLDATNAALDELSAKSTGYKAGDSVSVAAFPSSAEADELLGRLTGKHEVDIVSLRTLDAALGVSVSYRAGSGSCRLRVEFVPQTGEHGKLKLRVAPEISIGTGEGIETKRYQADVPGSGSFLIRGILEEKDRGALEKLFPGRSWANHALAIFVTAGTAKPVAAAVAQSSRGR
jgi:Flp pilus assembly protein CpaB